MKRKIMKFKEVNVKWETRNQKNLNTAILLKF